MPDDTTETITRVIQNNHPKLTEFSGASTENIRVFLDNLERRIRYEDWDSPKKLKNLRVMCTGGAAKFIENPQYAGADLATLKKALKERYGFSVSKADAYAIVMSPKQDNATVPEFAEVIENKTGELEDALAIGTGSKREELLITIFLKEARQALREALIVQDFTTFSRLLHKASLLEAKQAEGKKKTNYKPKARVGHIQDNPNYPQASGGNRNNRGRDNQQNTHA